MNDSQPEGHLASYIARRQFPSYAARRRGRSVAAVTRAQQPAMPVVGYMSGIIRPAPYCAVVKSAFL